MNYALARRYARALADIFFAAKVPVERRRDEVQKAKQNLTDFAALLAQQSALRNVLANPAVAKEKKLGLLDQLKGMLGLSPITLNFLAVLLDHRRLDQLEAVLSAFDSEVYARLGIVPVEVTTAVGLNPKQKKTLEDRLATLTGGQVEMRFRESEEILGGGVARLSSTIYDGSLRAQLQRLQRQLTTESGH